MILLHELINKLDAFCPPEKADSNDNIGLQFAMPKNQKINTIMIALDCDWETIKNAVAMKVEAILTHHNFFYPSKFKSLKNPETRAKWNHLKKHQIAVFSLHTNYDEMYLKSDLAIEYFSTKIKKIDNSLNYISITTLKEKTPIKKLLQLVKKTSKKWIEYSGDIERKVEKIAIIPGAGASLFEETWAQNVDLIITGEAKWSTWLKIKEKQKSVFIVGHQMEENFVSNLKNKLENIFSKDKISLKIIPHFGSSYTNFYD